MMRRVFVWKADHEQTEQRRKTRSTPKLRIALSGAGVEQAVADRHVQLVERLQSDESLFAPEVLAIGEELITLLRGMKKPRKGDVVAEMAASVLRVERIG